MSRKHQMRAKTGKQLAEKIRDACPGAVIVLTGNGHLKVTGPGGTAFIPSAPPDTPSARYETRNKLRAHAGIVIAV